jgi:Phosphate-selective porin O and P
MDGHRRSTSSFASVLAGVALARVLTGASSARAAEPWPPTTAPQVEGPVESPPARAPTPVVPAPSPPPALPPPPEPAPESVASAPDVVTVTSEPPRATHERWGSHDGQLFARTPRDELVLLPVARVELGGRGLATQEANASQGTLALDQARLDLAGWAYSKAYFDVSADFASGPSLRHVDNFVAIEPWGNRAILQVGQFDAPFSLENRTPDRYLDFAARGAAVRAFAIPENKDQGVMVHGADPSGRYYYSAGVFNGAGPGVTGVDAHVDVMGRAWVAPFAFGDPEGLRDIRLGASVWTGDHANGPLLAPQTTQGGYAIFDSNLWWTNGAASPFELREHGRLNAVGLELDAPIAHRFGVRFEWFAKRQALVALDVAEPAHPATAGGLTLSGWATYGEVWGWVVGDDEILGAPAAAGLELPTRLRELRDTTPTLAVKLSARVDYLDEQLTLASDATSAGLGVASVGTTKLTALTLGATGWYTRRARVTVDYVYNRLGGSTPYLNGLDARTEHELLVRAAFAL